MPTPAGTTPATTKDNPGQASQNSEDRFMRSFVVALVALAGVALSEAPALAQRGRGQAAARNGWLFSLDAGKRLARETGKPLMVVLRCEP